MQVIEKSRIKERLALIDEIQVHGVCDRKVLQLMSEIPREKFIPADFREEAYMNKPVSIGFGQTISQPLVVGLMTQMLQPCPTAAVLEIGTGSGYQALILSRLFRVVYTVERIDELCARAAATLLEYSGSTIVIVNSDGTNGLPEQAPYDRIIVTAAAPTVPDPLVDQLRDDGVLVIPIGGFDNQTLIRVTRKGCSFVEEEFGPVRFVPLIGKYGYSKKIR